MRSGSFDADNGWMSLIDGAEPPAAHIDASTRPDWMRTGYKFFPYAAHQSGQWWVLRLNHDFPEHDLYTIFIDGRATADINGNANDERPIVASVGALQPFADDRGEPELSPDVAAAIVGAVADYVVYGSEVGDPCDWCDHLSAADPMERL